MLIYCDCLPIVFKMQLAYHQSIAWPKVTIFILSNVKLMSWWELIQ